jgi:hypothetical protein
MVVPAKSRHVLVAEIMDSIVQTGLLDVPENMNPSPSTTDDKVPTTTTRRASEREPQRMEPMTAVKDEFQKMSIGGRYDMRVPDNEPRQEPRRASGAAMRSSHEGIAAPITVAAASVPATTAAPATSDTSEISDAGIINEIESRHFSMCGILSSRLAHLRTVRDVWSNQDPTAALQTLQTLQDAAVTSDVVRLVISLHARRLTVALGVPLARSLLLILASNPLHEAFVLFI